MSSASAEPAASPSASNVAHLPAPALAVGPVAFLGAIWLWTIYSLQGSWKDLEQYSYGYFVPLLTAYFVWRRVALFAAANPMQPAHAGKLLTLAAIASALVILPLEYFRLALPASRVSAWLIAINAVAFSMVFAWSLGGRALLRQVAFPLVFFLTAVPWFSFIEKAITMGLMEWVAAMVTEALHLCGIKAVQQGTVIVMTPGRMGIAEACSGIRSLQSGFMYALAVGELFLLTAGRRAALVGLTVLVAFILNLIRTFILCYQAEQHGVQILDKIHDQVGIIMSLFLPVSVWGLGKLFAGPEPQIPKEAEPTGNWVKRQLANFPGLRVATAVALAGFLPCHVWLYYQDFSVAKQTKPYFEVNLADPGNLKREVPKEIWNELKPTSGGYASRIANDLPSGMANSYYFFWEPSKDNFNILWHHPERCMVGAGWRPNGKSQQVEVAVSGVTNTWLLFPFKNDSTQVLQVWGAWRNGTPVIGNKDVKQLGLRGMLSQLRIFSKGNSATEIVSVSVPYKGDRWPIEEARRVVGELYKYTGEGAK